MAPPVEVNKRVSLLVTQSDGDQSIDSGVENDDLSLSFLDLDSSVTNPSVPCNDPQSKIIQKVQTALSDWDCYESELMGVIGKIDGMVGQLDDVGQETDRMIVKNSNMTKSFQTVLDNVSSPVKKSVAALAPQSDMVPCQVTSCSMSKQIQALPANDTKVTSSVPALPQKNAKGPFGHNIDGRNDILTTMDIHKLLLAANERTHSPSFYETRVKVAVNKVHLEIDEKSVPAKASKRAAKKGKGKSAKAETGKKLLSKRESLPRPVFDNKNCSDTLSKDALPPVTCPNRNEQKHEKKVLRTTLDFCEARLKSPELPPIYRKDIKSPMNRLGDREVLPPISPKPGMLTHSEVKNSFSQDERVLSGSNPTGGRDTCSLSVQDISRSQVPFLPILEPKSALTAPNAPCVLPGILKTRKEYKWPEVSKLPALVQNLPVIMPNAIQPKKEEKIPDRYVTWWPKNAGPIRGQKIESAEVVESTEHSLKQKRAPFALLPNKQNASQFLRKQNKNDSTHYRYF